MAVATLTGIPCRFRAGDTVRFTVSDSDHPASSWPAMAFTLRGKSLLTVAGVADGDAFTVTLTKTQTAALLPDAYNTSARYTDASGESESGCVRVIQVQPNLADTTIGPRRTAYNAAVVARDALAGRQFTSVSVEGESYTLQSLDGLQKLIDRLEIEAIREDRERGISNLGGLVRIQTRM